MVSSLSSKPRIVVAQPDVKSFVEDSLPKLPPVAKQLLVDILRLQDNVMAGIHNIQDLDGKALSPRISTEHFAFDERHLWPTTRADGSVSLTTQDVNYWLNWFIVGSRSESLDIANGSFDLRRSASGVIGEQAKIAVHVPNADENIPNVGWPTNHSHRSRDTNDKPNLLLARGLELEDPEGDNLAQLLYKFRRRMLQARKNTSSH